MITEFRSGNSGHRQTGHQEYPKTHKGCLGERKHTVSLHYGCNGVDRHPSCTLRSLVPSPPPPYAHPLARPPRPPLSSPRPALAFTFRSSLPSFHPRVHHARWLVGLAPGLHPRSHLFIIKFHVYRQPVRWRSEFLSECVHTRPRGGERERGYGDTYTYTHMYAHTHTDTRRAYRDTQKLTRTERTDTYTRASSRVNSPTPLSLSLSLSLFVSLYLSFFFPSPFLSRERKRAGRRGFARRSI